MKSSEEECRRIVGQAKYQHPIELSRVLNDQLAAALQERLGQTEDRDLVNANRVLKDEVDQLLSERDELKARVKEMEEGP